MHIILTNVTHPIGIYNPELMGINHARGLSFPLRNDMHKYLSIHGGKTWLRLTYAIVIWIYAQVTNIWLEYGLTI